MLSSLLLMVVTFASIALTYRKSRQRAASNSPKQAIQPAISRATTVPPSGVTYGDAPENNLEDAEESGNEASTPDPQQLQKEMDAHSPDQLSALNETYRGQWLKWRVIFKERKPVSAQSRLMFRFLEENTIINVVCDADAKQFPQVENWRTNERVWISGTIEEISEVGIRLQDIELGADSDSIYRRSDNDFDR